MEHDRISINPPREVLSEYLKWHNNWDELCSQCGKCCYTHRYHAGVPIPDYSDPCEHLDEETCLCKVFDRRFKVCEGCGKVTLFQALFNPLLPSTCAYVRTFRKIHQEE